MTFLQTTLFPPESAWRPPTMSQLPPDWNVASRVCVDTETCDPTLTTLGPGVRRGAYICGLCFALEGQGRGWYLPVRHLGGDNMADPTAALAYFRDQARNFTGEVVGAHLSYDLDFLEEAGITFPQARAFRDVLVAEPLLDELQYTYNLEAVLGRHGFEGKEETLFRQAVFAFGLDTKHPKKDLHKLPARFVGPYGEGDVTKPLQLLAAQEELMTEQDLGRIWQLESEVLPVLVRMRRRGVAVDFDHLDRVDRFSRAEEAKAWGELQRLTGVAVRLGDGMKAEVLAHALAAVGVVPPRTATGKPSIAKEWLEGLDNPAGAVIRRARKMSQLRTTFIASVRAHEVRGRVHCTFNQIVRQDDDDDSTQGAAYGRLSCVDPNLQQQPARDPELGPMWRKVYIPDAGAEWCSADYSQQEPRLALHFAVASGPARIGEKAYRGALEAAQRYHSDPSTDSHTMFTAMVHGERVWQLKGKELKVLRDPCKNIYLGIVYGMGGPKLCRTLGLPTKIIEHHKTGRRMEVAGDEGQALLNLVDERVPYLRRTANAVAEVAKSRGYVVTLLGRRCHFAKDPWGNYDYTHKALNRIVQGSAADQTKKAMVEMDREGIPLQLQVHDEVDFSIESRAVADRAARIMVECVPLHVPSKVDLEIGPSWGEAK